MIKINEILRQYYLNLFSSSAEITKNGNNNYIYRWNIRDLNLGNYTEIALVQIATNIPTLIDERQYPPKLYTSSTPEVELIYMNQNPVYYETITLNTDNITYGSGTYELYYSSSILGSRIKNLFNYILNDSTPHMGASRYNTSTGEYLYPTYSNYIVDGYFGDWLIIKLPNPIILTKYIIYNRPVFIERAPSLWRCYGSKDGVNYTEIQTGSNDLTALNITDYQSGFYEKILNQLIEYQYIGFVFKKIVGGISAANVLNFAEIQLFGIEKNNTYVIRGINTCFQDGFDSQNHTSAILYMGNGMKKIKNPSYHKLISNNLNSISLSITDSLDLPYNGINSNINFGVILKIVDYKNQEDKNNII